MPSLPTLEERVSAFLDTHGLRDIAIVVAVSGGPDSLALLVTLARLRGRFGLTLHAAHLDHQLRPESRAEAAYVRRVCRRLGVPVTFGRVDVAALQAREKISLEDAARRARYAFLAAVAQERGAAIVLTGHTADDQVETVLMHILRGTGLNGLRGMRPVTRFLLDGGQDVTVGRPFLEATRAETEACCRAARLRPRADPSNQDRRFLRNRVRMDVLPALETAQPGAREALRGLALVADEAQRYLESAADTVWRDVARPSGNAVVLDRRALADEHPAIRAEVYRRAARLLVGEPLPLERVHVAQMDALLSKTGEKHIDLPLGLQYTVHFFYAVLSLGEPPCPLPEVVEGRLPVPGHARLGRWSFETTVCEDGVRVDASPGAPAALFSPQDAWLPYRMSATIPHDRAQGGLIVRRRRPGDRVRLTGGTRKVQDILVDSKTPRGWRDCVPLVCHGTTGEPLWVVGSQRPPSLPENAGANKERNDHG